MQELGGELHLCNDAQHTSAGVCFELRVPQRVPVQQIVLVEAGGCFGIPVNHVRDVLVHDDAIDAIPLAHCLGTRSDTHIAQAESMADSASRRILMLTSHGRDVAVSVDAVAGYREVVTQSVGAQLSSLGRYSGAAALADGRCALLLDPEAWLAPLPDALEAKPSTESVPQHVLVVDDSPTQRAWLQSFLEQQGLEVILARDGQEALDLLEHQTVDLILLDIDMPRIDGYGVLDRLRQQRVFDPGVSIPPVLMLTSRSSDRDREAAIELGAADMFAKPVSSDTLQAALNTWLPAWA